MCVCVCVCARQVRMKTASGRRLAEGRHAFMQAYLAQFHAEVGGHA